MGTPRSGGLLTTQLEFNSIRLIYIYTCCQTHLVCAFWSTMLLRRPRMFQCLALPFHSHSGGRERSHGGCGTKQQSRVFAGNLESNLKGLRFTLVAEPLRRRPVKVISQLWFRNGVSLGLINSLFCI
jgi:hypothetical protein